MSSHLYFCHICQFMALLLQMFVFQLRTLFHFLSYNTLIHLSMKAAFTLIFEQSLSNTDVLLKLDQCLMEANLQVGLKEKIENGPLVYTICAQNFTNPIEIDEIMKNISTVLGLQAKGPSESKKFLSNKVMEKVTSQEIWTLSEQSSIWPHITNSNSNLIGTDPFQKFQEISDESEEFQLLTEEIQQIKRLRSEAVSQIRNDTNELDYTGKFQPVNENEVIEKEQKDEIKQSKAQRENELSSVELQQEFDQGVSIKTQNEQINDNNATNTIENTDQREKQIQIKPEQIEINQQQRQDTAEILFNYFTGKDDYTQVFKLQKSQNEQQDQIQPAEKQEETITEGDKLQSSEVQPGEAEVTCKISQVAQSDVLELSIPERIFIDESDPIQPENIQQLTDDCSNNYFVETGVQTGTQGTFSETQESFSKVQNKNTEQVFGQNEDLSRKSSNKVQKKVNEANRAFSQEKVVQKTEISNLVKFVIFFAMALAILAGLWI